MKLGKIILKIPTSRLAIFLLTRQTGNDFLPKDGLSELVLDGIKLCESSPFPPQQISSFVFSF